MPPTTDEERRIRSYLQAQAAKRSPAELVEKVRGAMEEVQAALFAVPADRFAARPIDGEWSANEVMAHVVSAGAHFARGIVRILDDGMAGPAVRDRVEAGVPVRTAEQWWNLLIRDRTMLFERVLRADP